MFVSKSSDNITRVYGLKNSIFLSLLQQAELTKTIRILTFPLAQGSHNKRTVPVNPFVHTLVLLEEKNSSYILWK